MKTIDAHTLLTMIEQGEAPTIVDVRTPAEFTAGHVPGAVNLPLSKCVLGKAELPDPATTAIVYCGLGPRAWMASVGLRRRGVREVVYLRGHWAAWRRAGLPTG